MAVAITGIEVLHNLATVHVYQKRRFAGTKYLVTTPDGTELFTLKEDNSALNFCFKNKSRDFVIDASNTMTLKVFSLRRRVGFSSDKVELYVDRRRVSVVRAQPTLVKAVFSINDGSDKPVLRVKAGLVKDHFALQTTNKRDIGAIKRTYDGLLNDIFSNIDDYTLTFPADLDTRYKAAAIAACIFIDYRYHS